MQLGGEVPGGNHFMIYLELAVKFLYSFRQYANARELDLSIYEAVARLFTIKEKCTIN